MPDSLISERPSVLNTANAVATLGVSGYGGAAFQIQGTYTGTITFEASVQGAEFTALRVVETDNSSPVTTTTGTGIFVCSVVGLTTIRARMSAYTNGAASVLIRAVIASPGSGGGGGGSGTDVNLIEVGGASIALGETTMSASLPVVIASDQTPIPITGSISATNPSVGATGDPVPTDATYIGILDPSGNLQGLAAETFDLDSGAGTALTSALAIALPASGGPVVGGTSTNPLRIDPTGTTPQPASQSGTWSVRTQDGSGNALASRLLNDQVIGTDRGLIVNSVIHGLTTAGGGAYVDVEVTPDGAIVAAGGGSAGTADTHVMTVQGIASMTPLLVTPAANSAVNVAQINGVTPLMGAGNTGTGSPRVTIATDQAVLPVGGNVANDSADSGNPVKVGAIAYSPDGTTPGTAVAEGDRSNAKTDLDGNLFVKVNPATSKTVHLDGSSAYTDQSLIADPGDGFQVVITNIIASTGAATALNFFLEEGSTKIFGPIYLEAVAGRGFCSGPIYLPCTASTAVTLTSSASIAQSYQVNYFVQAV